MEEINKEVEGQIRKIAEITGLSVEKVRTILFATPVLGADERELDTVFGTARKVGFDLSKLRISKRMALRRGIIQEMLESVSSHPEWDREAIIEYMERNISLIERVQNRILPKFRKDSQSDDAAEL